MSFLHQRIEGKGDIFCRDGVAVMEACARAKVVHNIATIFRSLDAFGNQPISAERLIVRGHQEGFVQVAVDAGGSNAADNERVEAVITVSTNRQSQASALGRVRVDVVKVLKARRVGRLSVHGESVHRLRSRVR